LNYCLDSFYLSESLKNADFKHVPNLLQVVCTYERKRTMKLGYPVCTRKCMLGTKRTINYKHDFVRFPERSLP